MAVFTSTRELQQQAQHKNFKKQTGWKASAMSMMGYKATGEKNTFGKYLGGSPMMTIGGNILAKGSDAEEVTKSQRGAELGHQIGVAKFVGSIMTAGAGGAAGGAASGGASAGASGASGAASAGGGLFGKAGTMGKGAMGGSTKAGAFISKVGGGSSQTALKGGKGSVLDNMANGESMFKEGSKVGDLANTQGGQMLSDKLQSEGKQAVMDQMSKDSEGMTDEEIKAMAETESTTEQDAVSQAGNAQVDSTVESGSAKATGQAADATSAIPLIGEGVGLYAEKMAIADAYKSKRKEISGRTYSGNEAHRA